MTDLRTRLGSLRSVCLLSAFIAACGLAALARADAYDPPANYYSGATGTGAALKNQLTTIISSGVVNRTYGDFRYSSAILDQDPNNSSNIRLVYNGASVSGAWDQGVTWNREHTWPQSLLGISVNNSSTGVGADEFELRPVNPSVNSSRGNLGYGSIHTASYPSYGSVTANDGSGSYWYPGLADRGEVARSMFYITTRYASSGYTLVNGQPSTGHMGDLESLLHWNYESPVDNFERRRNQYVYDSSLNPTYYQGNRNPFIDHPEYVWTIFGTGANTSQLSVATPASDGSSAATVNLGRVIHGSSFGTQGITLNKTGSTPTTFDVLTSGSASSNMAGPRQAFDYGAQSNAMQVGLAGSTATPGPLSGTVTVHNTDLTSAASGEGSADGNDTVNVSGTVVDPSNASFSLTSTTKTLSIDFGTVPIGASGTSKSFSLANITSASGYTAGLRLLSVGGTGNTSTLTTTLSPFASLTAGQSNSFNATLNTSSSGSFSAEYTLGVSDENIPGATAGQNLILDLTGTVAVPEPAGCMLLLPLAFALRRPGRTTLHTRRT